MQSKESATNVLLRNINDCLDLTKQKLFYEWQVDYKYLNNFLNVLY